MISTDGEVCFSISKIEHSDMEQQLGGMLRLVMMDDVMMVTLATEAPRGQIGQWGHLCLQSLEKGLKIE